MSFWKQSLRKTDLLQKILLILTHGKNSLWEMILGMRTRGERESPEPTHEFDQFDSERLDEVLQLSQKDSWETPEGYVAVVTVEQEESPPSSDPVPEYPQFEASDSHFEAGELQPEPGDPQPEISEPQPETVDAPSEARELQPDVGDLPLESGVLPFEAVVSQAEAIESPSETVEEQSESSELQAEESDLQPEAEELQSESSDLPVEVGEREPEDPALLADEMAANFYGFGDWSAPYWFIGLEPGKAPGEEADNSHIVRAWANGLKRGDLVDCLEYHQAIGVDTWHKEKAKLMATWRPLMLFLMTMLDRAADKEALRAYQRTRWGQMEDGETCVIELSGIPAKNLAVETDRRKYLQPRMEAIREKIENHKPRVVLMYGLTAQSEWERIAGNALKRDEVLDAGSTLFVMTPSPTAFGRKNADWENLGLQLRERLSSR